MLSQDFCNNICIPIHRKSQKNIDLRNGSNSPTTNSSKSQKGNDLVEYSQRKASVNSLSTTMDDVKTMFKKKKEYFITEIKPSVHKSPSENLIASKPSSSLFSPVQMSILEEIANIPSNLQIPIFQKRPPQNTEIQKVLKKSFAEVNNIHKGSKVSIVVPFMSCSDVTVKDSCTDLLISLQKKIKSCENSPINNKIRGN